MPAQVSRPNSSPGTYQGAFTTEISAQPSQNRKPRAAPPAARIAAPASVFSVLSGRGANACAPAAAQATASRRRRSRARRPGRRSGRRRYNSAVQCGARGKYAACRDKVVDTGRPAGRIPANVTGQATAVPAHARELHRTHPEGARLRRRHRVAARGGATPVTAPRQPGPVQARGPAAGLLVQAARRLQQDLAPLRDRRPPRRDLRLGRQPCPGRGAGGAPPRHCGRDRDAADHAEHQGPGGARPRRRGGAARRRFRPRLRAGGRDRARAGTDVHPPVRRPRRHRRAGHHRHGDPAPALGGRSTRYSCRSAEAGSLPASRRT